MEKFCQMNQIQKFKQDVQQNISKLGEDKDLQEFSRGQSYGELPLSTMTDHLPWYGLEKVCGTYHKE